MHFSRPSEENSFLAAHIELLRNSFHHWTGHNLVDPRMTDVEAARSIFFAPFVVISHDTSGDPIFNYGNETALRLFGLPWEQFTMLPSRYSAEAASQGERALLLNEVSSKGFMDHYQGIRVTHGGHRFRIEQTTVWNVIDKAANFHGQAAMFHHWSLLDAPNSDQQSHPTGP